MIKTVQAASVRDPFNYDVDDASFQTGIDTPEDAIGAQQQFKEEADINTIVKRFGLTGEMPGDLAMPVSGDFTDVVDYHSAMTLVRAADEQFLRIPAHVRARFGNSPQALVSFLEDADNRPEAERLGLVKPLVKVEVPAVSTASGDAPGGAGKAPS